MVITVSETKGIKCQVGDLSLLVDPDKVGSADAVLYTAAKVPFETVPQNVVIGPGEYEISGIRVIGAGLERESDAKRIRTAYTAIVDGIRLCFLGLLGAEVSDDALDKLGETDILIVGAASGMDVKKVVQLARQMEPKIIIPLSNHKEFASELGQKPEKEEKWVGKLKDIETFNSKLIWLTEK
ncbi:MAG: hypothetical protein A3B23_01795 [Candidatus Colwellbacteria bacterium RIFCSPLOWO2_01_FULL_48_10]|uniref:Uncharacterized protein n=1 Tax=Candidatus Colwellbacteria bacterium RIFCSPLOWO2_01_FULL_48_10 TaxID=1797690 RepID=A0A1G1Z6Y0_9BACT|nr:MAG: hypothetical protein A3B23_01795 [Candidatus Colwellbacteria bacterium RIFCSPLOWO2_01_FULL_48_10]